MSDAPGAMNCQQFQALLPELISDRERAFAHPHYRGCPLCRALIADLDSIAEAARQLMDTVDPPAELWEQIASAIRAEDESVAEPPTDEPPHTTAE